MLGLPVKVLRAVATGYCVIYEANSAKTLLKSFTRHSTQVFDCRISLFWRYMCGLLYWLFSFLVCSPPSLSSSFSDVSKCRRSGKQFRLMSLFFFIAQAAAQKKFWKLRQVKQPPHALEIKENLLTKLLLFLTLFSTVNWRMLRKYVYVSFIASQVYRRTVIFIGVVEIVINVSNVQET